MNPDLMQELQNFTEAPRVEGLGELSTLVAEMLKQEEHVNAMKAILATEEAKLQTLRTAKIPGLMAELGLSEVKTESGHKIYVDQVVTCKLFPGHQDEALKWLEQNEYGGLIKHEVSLKFGKDSEGEVSAAVRALNAAGFRPDVEKGVHPMTLKAWAKRQVEGGGQVPTNLFDLNTFSIAKVK